MRVNLIQCLNLWNGEIIGNNVSINGISTLYEAKPEELAFFIDLKYKKYLSNSKAGAILIPEKFKKIISDYNLKTTLWVHPSPEDILIDLIEYFYPSPPLNSEISIHSIIHPDTKIGLNTKIDEAVIIKKGVAIGQNCLIGSKTFIGENTIIGNNCIIDIDCKILNNIIIGNNVYIGVGSIIGADGFGFISTSKGLKHLPHKGRVIINDNVYIGANTIIARGSISDTIIESDVKIDNLVQIAHNVKIGENTIIAAQTGIAGSSQIGKGVIIGGQVGIGDHKIVGDFAQIASKSGPLGDVESGSVIAGYPAMPKRKWLKLFAILERLLKKGI